MKRMLYDMRKDAIEKLKAANEDDGILLLDAIGRLKVLFDVASRDGLLALSSVLMSEKSAYLKMLALTIEDGRDSEYVMEIGTNEYWIQNPQGVEAFLCYIYLRGMLCIQVGYNREMMETLFRSLIPERWRTIYYERFGNKLDDTLRYKKTEKSFFNLYPVFETKELLQKISALQEKIGKLNDISLWQILMEWESRNDALIKCLYGFNRKTREKIINCQGKMQVKLLMEDTVCLLETEVEETDVLQAVDEMDDILEMAINWKR